MIAVAPDYAENVKFADEWVSPAPGTDGALAMGMGHVILKEYFAEATVGFFEEYNKQFTDLPFLVRTDTRELVRLHDVLALRKPGGRQARRTRHLDGARPHHRAPAVERHSPAS